jgi:hypothetical protein
MNENVTMFIIVIGVFLAGGIAGYLLNEVTVLEDYASQCEAQCESFMEAKHCIWHNEPFKYNYSLGGQNVLAKENKTD